MNCPICSTKSAVLHTKTGAVNVRMRECAKGHRFVTQEAMRELLVGDQRRFNKSRSEVRS